MCVQDCGRPILLNRGVASLASFFFFFFNDTATTEIYTLSLHDALPICSPGLRCERAHRGEQHRPDGERALSPRGAEDRKSTRLNSSHSQISYAVFCLKKKKKAKLFRGCATPYNRLIRLISSPTMTRSRV